MNFLSLNKLKRDLKICKNYWTVVYGSILTMYYMPNRSDIDIAVITRSQDIRYNRETLKKLLEQIPPRYDVRIFEIFPLYIKMEIINNYVVLFGDPLDISEYFYYYRSIWKDMEPRIRANQFKSVQEKLEILERRKEL
ncbi:MAG: nucleotidyltransferase domain-containing protein [Promethearchaeota archaeon]